MDSCFMVGMPEQPAALLSGAAALTSLRLDNCELDAVPAFAMGAPALAHLSLAGTWNPRLQPAPCGSAWQWHFVDRLHPQCAASPAAVCLPLDGALGPAAVLSWGCGAVLLCYDCFCPAPACISLCEVLRIWLWQVENVLHIAAAQCAYTTAAWFQDPAPEGGTHLCTSDPSQLDPRPQVPLCWSAAVPCRCTCDFCTLQGLLWTPELGVVPTKRKKAQTVHACQYSSTMGAVPVQLNKPE